MERSSVQYMISILVLMVFGLLMAFPIMWCWNYTMVDIFKLPVINWGQSYCLYILSNWFIKSFHFNEKFK